MCFDSSLKMHLPVIVTVVLMNIIGKSTCDTSMEEVRAIWSRYTQVSKGDSTYYGNYPGGGACELDPFSPVNSQPGWIKVAAGEDDYQKSLGCGMCVEFEGDGTPSNPASGGNTPMKGPYKATVIDLCGGCKQGGFDLYITGDGKWKTSYKAIECASVSGQDGNIQFRFDGSNNWFLQLQVRNSKVVTVGLEILNDNKWICMHRLPKNHFKIDGLGEIKFPIKLRLTSIFNEQLESTINTLENDVNIPTKIQYKGIIADSKPEDIKCFGQGGVTQEAKNPVPLTKATPTPKPHPSPFPEPTPSSKPQEGGSSRPSPTNAGTTQKQGKPEEEKETKNPVPPTKATPTPKPHPSPFPEPTPSSKPQEGGSSRPSPTNAGTTQKQGKPEEEKDFCKVSGLYPDENDCFSFIVCSNGTTFKKKCPAGLKFSRDLKVCDWPRNVDCKKNTISSK